jgi:hypothetical protein
MPTGWNTFFTGPPQASWTVKVGSLKLCCTSNTSSQAWHR